MVLTEMKRHRYRLAMYAHTQRIPCFTNLFMVSKVSLHHCNAFIFYIIKIVRSMDVFRIFNVIDDFIPQQVS